jgi:CHASE2 domain-containing sensor protein
VSNNPWVRKLVWIVFLYALGAACFVFHGIAFHLTPWSQAVVNGIVKHWYPDVKREETTVVLFREQNLEDLGETYPVSYKTHAQVLRRLLDYKPRAVFVDFMFLEKRANEPELRDAICKLTENGIPVYLASPSVAETHTKGKPDIKNESNANRVVSRVRQELLNCREPSPSGIKPQLVNAEMESTYGVSGVLEYKLEGKTADGKEDSPAMAMLPPELKSSMGKEPMEIIWPSGRPLPVNNWIICERTEGLVEILSHGPETEEIKSGCPYTPTISVRHLLKDEHPHITNALEKRSVFYGAGFEGAGDVLVSPVYKAMPAVYLHAIAHDNLLTLGNNYKRAKTTLISQLVNHGLLLVIVLILIFPAAIIGWFTTRITHIYTVVDVVSHGQSSRLHVVSRIDIETKPIRSRWLPLATALAWVALACLIGWQWQHPSAHAWNAFVWATVLGVSVLVWVFALPYLEDSAAQARNNTQEQHEFRQHVFALLSPMVLGAFFLLFYIWLEFETALLLSLGGYFFYKLFFAKDRLFVVITIPVVVASLFSFWPGNLGPRNVIAYLLFFEVARHLLEHAGEVWAKYQSIQSQSLSPEAKWGWWGRGWRFKLLNTFCQLCDWEGKDEYRNKPATSGNVDRRAAHGG